MGAYVVDVNVATVANGDHEQATAQCRWTCVNALKDAREGLTCLDAGGLIMMEYWRRGVNRGQPGLGAEFVFWLHQNGWNSERCERIRITARAGMKDDFEEFPSDQALAAFDRDDRKYVAVALASRNKPVVLNACDSDWWRYRAPLEGAGVRMRFICPELMPSE